VFAPEDGPDSLSEVGASGEIWLGAHGWLWLRLSREACVFARQVFRQKCSYADGLSENTRIQVASRLQARRDLFGINAGSQTVMNIL